jgi:hypothetical protein
MRQAPGLKQKQNSSACSSWIVSGTCQAHATQFQVYVETCRHHTKLSCNVPPFLTLHSVKKNPRVHSKNTPSHADTPSIWSYSPSPLKTSRVTEVSWLVLHDQILLLWEVVIKIMDNPTNKLSAFCTTGRLSQEVGQIIICLNLSN